MFFATQLLRSATEQNQEQESQASTSTTHVEHDENTSIILIDEESFEEATTETQEFEGNAEGRVSLYRWTPPCVLLLLETYRSMEGILNKGKISQKKFWSKISEELKTKGYDVTGPQCHSKLRSLKKTYKSTKDYNQKSGNNRKTWQFYEVTWCDPVAVASSTGLSTIKLETTVSAVDWDSGCSTKSRKTSIATLFQKRLEQKKDHEESKKKETQ
ncbi:hypothetical protein PV327_001626 [Microctonus hyperodae]|uniref:Myb/SANT-like DNA-binding domain-containing protein n=1 Tax=Microctonus hyperodae TaxID=165561 RepID=A0AA39FDV8_MICHY|nr:hypothetical protein PV327_001626 [Microctonus hyperodae]